MGYGDYMKGELRLVDEIELGEEEFSICASLSDFTLAVYVDKEKTLEKQANRLSTDPDLDTNELTLITLADLPIV